MRKICSYGLYMLLVVVRRPKHGILILAFPERVCIRRKCQMAGDNQ